MFNPFELVFRIFELLISFTRSAWRVLNWSFEVGPVLFLPEINISVWGVMGGAGLLLIVGSAILKLIPGA